jgi:UDP-N-acetylmuramate: L-alanyl-gamma-D-glutamyl-meso-diaminopimelate ligase
VHIHILGICGTFMGGIAAIAASAGHKVTGCDANVYPPMSDQLRSLGIELIEGFGLEQLALKPDLWVVGNVVARGNALMEAIMNSADQRYISGPQWLAEQVLHDKWVLAVAGTHGKTTTASLLAWVLEQNGLNPSFLIGGVPGGFGVSARLTESSFFVIEADEYDTAFFDKRSKFVHYRPRTAVLNNLEFDHADIFADLAAIETQFHHLVRTVPGNGAVIANAAEPALTRVMERGCWSQLQWFNSDQGWQAQAEEETAHASRFSVSLTANDGTTQSFGVCDSPMSGAHSRANALAVIAAAAHVGIRPEMAMRAIARFPGVKRRMELRGERRGVQVIDDFAHHPTAIATTIEGLRARLGAGSPRRILAVLEPRSNTMKLGVVKAALAESLAGADAVFCYSKGLSWDAAEALAPIAARTTVMDKIDPFVAAIAAQATKGDVILVMSNGGFEGIHERLLKALG